MGSLDDKKVAYSNGDVIEAVRKITGKEIEKNTEMVQSKKGNDVDISDLWVNEMIRFSINDSSFEVTPGTTWNDYLSGNNPNGAWGWLWDKTTGMIFYYLGNTSQVYGSPLTNSQKEKVYKDDLIKSDKYYYYHDNKPVPYVWVEVDNVGQF